MGKKLYGGRECKKYCVSDEYKRVIDEELARIDKIFSNGYTFVTMVTLIWTLAISSFVGLLSSDKWIDVAKNHEGLVFLVGFMQFFCLPFLF